MEFSNVIDGPHYGPIGRLAGIFIVFVLIAFFYCAVAMLVRYIRLRRCAQMLILPLQAQMETGQWEPAKLSWPDIKQPKLRAISEALRLELPGRRPLAAISTLDQVLDLLAAQFIRMTHYLKALGWAVCLVSLLGALSELRNAFYGMARTGSGALGAASSSIAEIILLLIFGLAVGLACLGLSSFGRIQLQSTHQGVSDRILAALSKKAN